MAAQARPRARDRIATSFVKYRRRPEPAAAPEPVPAPRGDDVLRTRAGRVELTLLCLAALAAARLPRALRISFAPAGRPAHIRVVRWWRVRRIPVSALLGITVIEYRYRESRETAAGDARRETVSRLPYRIDAVLHRDAGGSWTVRGKGGEKWKPDTRDMYGPLADMLAQAGLTIDRQFIWTQRPVRNGRWFSPGSGGANALGGILP